MKRETFIKAIEAIKKQLNHDTKVSEKFGEVFPNAFNADLMPDNHFLLNALIDVLGDEIDGDGWIEWFCFEADFGVKAEVLDENKQPVKMTNAGDLYDFLNKQNTKK